jgi:hypothetical protein
LEILYAKANSKAFQVVFPILAGEIQMTMPGPNARPQTKIKDIGNYTEDIYIPGKKVWAVLLPFVVVKRLLCSLAMSFKQVIPISPIDLRSW